MMEGQGNIVRLYCRNCGQLGHGFCKKQFSAEERLVIDATVLEIKRSNKLVAQANKRSGLQCSQCGQHGHSFFWAAEEGGGSRTSLSLPIPLLFF